MNNNADIELIDLPCGAHAVLENQIVYRCTSCFTVAGSVDMPRSCSDEMQKFRNWRDLGGADWDYNPRSVSSYSTWGYKYQHEHKK
jgi:hypothetical protein